MISCLQTVNENSLKQLSSILETLQQKQRILPTTLPFYLRSKDEKDVKAGKFTFVKIQLKQEDLKQVILSILKTCDLPTTFVEKIEKEKPPVTNYKSRFWQGRDSGEIDFSELEDNLIYASILMKRKISLEPDTFK